MSWLLPSYLSFRQPTRPLLSTHPQSDSQPSIHPSAILSTSITTSFLGRTTTISYINASSTAQLESLEVRYAALVREKKSLEERATAMQAKYCANVRENSPTGQKEAVRVARLELAELKREKDQVEGLLVAEKAAKETWKTNCEKSRAQVLRLLHRLIRLPGGTSLEGGKMGLSDSEREQWSISLGVDTWRERFGEEILSRGISGMEKTLVESQAKMETGLVEQANDGPGSHQVPAGEVLSQAQADCGIAIGEKLADIQLVEGHHLLHHALTSFEDEKKRRITAEKRVQALELEMKQASIDASQDLDTERKRRIVAETEKITLISQESAELASWLERLRQEQVSRIATEQALANAKIEAQLEGELRQHAEGKSKVLEFTLQAFEAKITALTKSFAEGRETIDLRKGSPSSTVEEISFLAGQYSVGVGKQLEGIRERTLLSTLNTAKTRVEKAMQQLEATIITELEKSHALQQQLVDVELRHRRADEKDIADLEAGFQTVIEQLEIKCQAMRDNLEQSAETVAKRDDAIWLNSEHRRATEEAERQLVSLIEEHKMEREAFEQTIDALRVELEESLGMVVERDEALLTLEEHKVAAEKLALQLKDSIEVTEKLQKQMNQLNIDLKDAESEIAKHVTEEDEMTIEASAELIRKLQGETSKLRKEIDKLVKTAKDESIKQRKHVLDLGNESTIAGDVGPAENTQEHLKKRITELETQARSMIPPNPSELAYIPLDSILYPATLLTPHLLTAWLNVLLTHEMIQAYTDAHLELTADYEEALSRPQARFIAKSKSKRKQVQIVSESVAQLQRGMQGSLDTVFGEMRGTLERGGLWKDRGDRWKRDLEGITREEDWGLVDEEGELEGVVRDGPWENIDGWVDDDSFVEEEADEIVEEQ